MAIRTPKMVFMWSLNPYVRLTTTSLEGNRGVKYLALVVALKMASEFVRIGRQSIYDIWLKCVHFHLNITEKSLIIRGRRIITRKLRDIPLQNWVKSLEQSDSAMVEYEYRRPAWSKILVKSFLWLLNEATFHLKFSSSAASTFITRITSPPAVRENQF